MIRSKQISKEVTVHHPGEKWDVRHDNILTQVRSVVCVMTQVRSRMWVMSDSENCFFWLFPANTLIMDWHD